MRDGAGDGNRNPHQWLGKVETNKPLAKTRTRTRNKKTHHVDERWSG